MAIFYANEARRRLRDSGMSLREFSVRAGLPNSSVSAWLRGARKPKFNTVTEIASALGCSICDISSFQVSEDCGRQIPEAPPIITTPPPVLDRLAEKMKDCAKERAGARWNKLIAEVREVVERHFRRFDDAKRDMVFRQISQCPDSPPAIAIEYMAERIIEQMVPVADIVNNTEGQK